MRVVMGSVFAVLLASSASAESDHIDCTGSDCMHTHCYSDGVCDRPEYDARDTGYETVGYELRKKPMRYACDTHGYDCHYTRRYTYNEYGEMVYDPNAPLYQ